MIIIMLMTILVKITTATIIDCSHFSIWLKGASSSAPPHIYIYIYIYVYIYIYNTNNTKI